MVHEHCILAIMQYRKLKAKKIFNGLDWLKEDEVVFVSGNGVIEAIVQEQDAGDGIELLDGILTPGFINCHCHIELSHLKNVILPGAGLVNFLLAVIKQRGSSAEIIQEHAQKAEEEMADNGIVAIADVCNSSYAIAIKRKSRLYFHNLIEVINLYDENLRTQLAQFNLLLTEHKDLDLDRTSHSLTPHAPYSVSKSTFKAINEASANAIISIHNQETQAENQLFQTGQGSFLTLYKELRAHSLPIEICGKTSFQTWLPYFTKGQTILIVHNTFISEEDILFGKVHSERFGLDLIYCLCPNANLYIENCLPPVELLIKHNCKIVLGTDSYASNGQLNMAAEIKTLCSHFPEIALESILQWATKNGANALRQNSLGSLEKGMKPGLVILETDRLNNEYLTGRSKRII